jgi:hypothetical protein
MLQKIIISYLKYRQIWLNILVRLLPLEQDNKIKEQNTPDCCYAMFFSPFFVVALPTSMPRKI